MSLLAGTRHCPYSRAVLQSDVASDCALNNLEGELSAKAIPALGVNCPQQASC